jgi:hypothetical protein
MATPDMRVMAAIAVAVNLKDIFISSSCDALSLGEKRLSMLQVPGSDLSRTRVGLWSYRIKDVMTAASWRRFTADALYKHQLRSQRILTMVKG